MPGTAGQPLQDGTARRILASASTPSGARHLKKRELGGALQPVSVGSLKATQIVKVSLRFDHLCFDARSETHTVHSRHSRDAPSTLASVAVSM